MPATPWTELTGAAPAWQEGITVSDGDDFFIDVLFEGTGTTAIMPFAGTELSLGVATPSTELSITATPWTELAG